MQDDEKMFLQKLCQKFRKLRLDKGLTLEEAETLGWKNGKHLQRIETQPNDIQILTLFRISKLYKKRMSVILAEIEPKGES